MKRLFTKFQWEPFIKDKLPSLQIYQFYFSCYPNRFGQYIDPLLILVPFKTLFWLNKGWFVTCNYIKTLYLIRIYSIPVCVSDFSYMPQLDQVSDSTNYIMNNDPSIMDNVNTLVSDLTKEMFSIVPIKVSFKYEIISS